MKPEGLIDAVSRAIEGAAGPRAYHLAFAHAAQAYEADPPPGWDLLSPSNRVAMIEGSTRTALSALGFKP